MVVTGHGLGVMANLANDNVGAEQFTAAGVCAMLMSCLPSSARGSYKRAGKRAGGAGRAAQLGTAKYHLQQAIYCCWGLRLGDDLPVCACTRLMRVSHRSVWRRLRHELARIDKARKQCTAAGACTVVAS